MNFTPELSAFQGTILSADNVRQFSRLTARGGNEDSIDYVLESLSTFLEQSQYIINGKISRSANSQVRKFALYIILNSDLPELQQLVELEEISTLIWTTPTIPKCLMCEIMWNLHMETFISEIICYANPQLALEVADAFLVHFKYFDPLDCLDQLQLISSACYTLMCRLVLFNFHHSSELESKLGAAYNTFLRCLNLYTAPPNNLKINALTKVELYKYQGESLHSLMQLMDECFSKFTSKLEPYPARAEIYKLTHMEESDTQDFLNVNVCDISSDALLDCVGQANLVFLDTCKVLVMDVSVDVFCCWSEFEVNGKTMQQIVGELCFKVHNKLSNVTTLREHPLVNMLKQISRKPVEMKEKINATEDNDIIKNIRDNTEDSDAWIKALVHKEKLCQSSELLDIVHANVNIYDKDESYKLYTNLTQNNTLDLDNKDFIELLLVKVFEKCELSKKYTILENHFSNKTFVDMKETPQFTNTMTSLFNKVIASPDADLTDTLTLFLQNPRHVLTKIFNLASENSQQAQIMLRIMKLLHKFSDHYYSTDTESCVILMTQKIFEVPKTEAKEDNFIQFVCGLKNANIIPGTKLLLLIIMTNMYKALLNSSISSLYIQLKLLKEAYNLEELMEYRAPILAMIAQILDVVRWQTETFTAKADATLNLAIEIVNTLFDSYHGVIPENENQWLMTKLKNIKPLNMYYYRALWETSGTNYLEIVSGMTVVEDMSLNSLTSWLSQVICLCTQQEWCEIWDSLAVFDDHMALSIIHAALAMLTVAEKVNRNDNSYACIFFCYRNFMHVTRYKFITEPVTDDHVQSIIRKAAMIIELVGEDNVEEYGNTLMPLFAYLMEKQSDYNINLGESLNKHLGHTRLSPMINRIFVNGST